VYVSHTKVLYYETSLVSLLTVFLYGTDTWLTISLNFIKHITDINQIKLLHKYSHIDKQIQTLKSLIN